MVKRKWNKNFNISIPDFLYAFVKEINDKGYCEDYAAEITLEVVDALHTLEETEE